MDDLNLNQLLNLGQLITLVAGILWGAFKLGGKFDNFVDTIRDTLANHEVRITKLERHPVLQEGNDG